MSPTKFDPPSAEYAAAFVPHLFRRASHAVEYQQAGTWHFFCSPIIIRSLREHPKPGRRVDFVVGAGIHHELFLPLAVLRTPASARRRLYELGFILASGRGVREAFDWLLVRPFAFSPTDAIERD